jgi:hypothetical protein
VSKFGEPSPVEDKRREDDFEFIDFPLVMTILCGD